LDAVILDTAILEAVRDIENRLPPETSAAVINIISPSERFSSYIIDEITAALVKGKKLTVVERKDLERVREEQNFQLSGDVSDESMRSIGKMLGAEYILSGSCIDLGDSFRLIIKTMNVTTAVVEAMPAVTVRRDDRINFLVSGSADSGTDLEGLRCVIQAGHTGVVRSAVFSPDGKYIASGAEDRMIKIWDAGTGRELRTLSGHNGAVHSAAYSPNGEFIVSASGDSTVRIWDAETGRELRVLPEHTASVNQAVFSPDGRSIASASTDKTVKLWDAGSGSVLRSFTGNESSANTAAFSPDGRRLAAGFGDKTIKIWSIRGAGEPQSFSVVGYIKSLAWSLDGRTILAGTGNGIGVYNAGNGQVVKILAQGRNIRSVALSRDGKQVLAGENYLRADYVISFWDLESGKGWGVPSDVNYGIYSAAFSPDGNRIVAGVGDFSVRVYDFRSREEIRVLANHRIPVTSAAFSADGKKIIAGYYDNSVRIWDLEKPGVSKIFRGEGMLRAFALSPDGRRLISAEGEDTIKIWNAESGRRIDSATNDKQVPVAIHFAPDGRSAVISGGKKIRIIDPDTGAALRILPEQSESVQFAAYSADGARIISVYQGDGYAYEHFPSPDSVGLVALSRYYRVFEAFTVWDVVKGEKISGFDKTVFRVPSILSLLEYKPLQINNYGIRIKPIFNGVPFSYEPHSGRLAFNYGKEVHLMDTVNGKDLGNFPGLASTVSALALSSGGSFLAAGCADGVINIWEVETRRELSTIAAHDDTVTALAYSPRGRRILSSSLDGLIRIRDAASGRELFQFACFDDGEWLCTGPEGYYSASRNGERYLAFVKDGVMYTAETYRSAMNNPAVLAAELSGM
jgi:WD40 repeat protein